MSVEIGKIAIRFLKMRFCLVGEVYVVAKASVVGYFSEPIVAASHVFAVATVHACLWVEVIYCSNRIDNVCVPHFKEEHSLLFCRCGSIV